MKKRFSLLAAILAAGTLSTPAMAADHYVSGAIGISWLNDVPALGSKFLMNSGITGTAAVGCDYKGYRFEGEAGYQDSSIKTLAGANYDGNVSVYSLMANGYYDINAGGVKPFIMGGVGIAQAGFNNIKPSGIPAATWSSTETTLAYQAGVGLAVPIGNGLNLDAKYRYFSTTNFSAPVTGFNNNTHVSSNSLLVGLRMNF